MFEIPCNNTKKPTYKYCIVPMCLNTVISAPNKVFFLVPRGEDIRSKWCKTMKRHNISPSTCLYCCEDHFNIEEDTSNYIEYKIMSLEGKNKIKLRLKEGVLPHKFDCQKDINKLQQQPDRKSTKLNNMHFLLNFNPETSARERRKINRKSYFTNKKNKTIYNDRGLIAETGKDLCDCLDETCPGCHFPCPKCNSNKCGHECRINRKWMYDKIEVEGNDFVIKNDYKSK